MQGSKSEVERRLIDTDLLFKTITALGSHVFGVRPSWNVAFVGNEWCISYQPPRDENCVFIKALSLNNALVATLDDLTQRAFTKLNQ